MKTNNTVTENKLNKYKKDNFMEKVFLKRSKTHDKIIEEEYNFDKKTNSASCILSLKSGECLMGEYACGDTQDFDEDVLMLGAKKNALKDLDIL